MTWFLFSITGPAWSVLQHSPPLELLISALVFLAHCLGLISAVQAIMETRTSQGAIAWGISLLTFPWIAVPAYWVFGQSRFRDYEVIRRRGLLDSTDTMSETARVLRDQELLTDADADHPFPHTELLQKLAKLPATRRNSAELLINGQNTFDAIFAAMASARRYILVQFYILRDDRLGTRLKNVLLERAHAGVRVYVLYDELGSSRLSESWIAELREAGIAIHPFNTTRGRGNRFRLNFRNHRKIVIVDGVTAFVGGHNVGDEYLGHHPVLTPWRDTHVAVRGPVVQCVQVSFVEDWLWAVGSIPEWRTRERDELNWHPEPAPDSDMIALCMPTGPADDLETCTLFFLDLINSATKRLWIVSPYFVPDPQLLSALQLAALRGVDVRILIPDRPDQKLVWYSSFSYLEEAEQTGVRVFRYARGFLHQKVMLIDDHTAAVGTANFDNRSMRLNFEVTMLFADAQFARQVAAMLEDDFADSREVFAAEYTEAPFWFRLIVRVARLMAPIQ